jgi:HEAT repeat protein
MRRRWLIGIALVVGCALAVSFLYPAAIYVPLGHIRNEAFFEGKPTTYWMRALQHERFLGEEPAAGDIGKTLREGGANAVPVLSEIAASPDENLKSEALLGLVLIGADAKAAKPVLTSTIKTEKNSTRFLLASEALAKVDSPAAVEALSEVVRDKADFARRAWACTALLKFIPNGQGALPALQEVLDNKEEDSRLRVQAIEVLWHLGQPTEPLIEALCSIACDPKSNAGVQALTVLSELGTAGKPALPTLLKLLENPQLKATGDKWGPVHRAAVIRALGKLGPDASPAIPSLIAMLKNDKLSGIYKELADALGQMGPKAKDAVPSLVATLKALQAQKTRSFWDNLTMVAVRQAVPMIDAEAATRAGIH